MRRRLFRAVSGAAEIAVTVDVDWAPDWAIDLTAGILRDHGVRATWFITHASPAVERLRQDPELFELGIHPNFLPASTQGSSPDEVLDHCLGLVPGAVTMRAHALAMSSPLLHQIAESTSIEIDVSLFCPYMPGIHPVLYAWEGRTLVRVPYFWEDDHEMELEPPRWEAERIARLPDGIKVINFHPIHVFLNSSSMDAYRRLVAAETSTEAEEAAFAEGGEGTRTFFEGLVAMLEDTESWRIRDLRERFPARWPSRDHPLGNEP